MNEFKIYRKAVISELNGFLNRTLDGGVINATTDRIAKKFALTQEQRCAVKIALSYMDMVHHSFGDCPEGFDGITINLITRIVMKDWDGVEKMLND